MQVELTLVSALFMFPTGVVFPAILRVANTPPSSQTLEMAPRTRRDEPGGPATDHHDHVKVAQEERDADFRRVLEEGERNVHRSMPNCATRLLRALVGITRTSRKSATFFGVRVEIVRMIDNNRVPPSCTFLCLQLPSADRPFSLQRGLKQGTEQLAAVLTPPETIPVQEQQSPGTFREFFVGGFSPRGDLVQPQHTVASMGRRLILREILTSTSSSIASEPRTHTKQTLKCKTEVLLRRSVHPFF